MNKEDKWLWVLIVSIIVLVIVVIIFVLYQQNKMLDFNGMKISQRNYDTINRELGQDNLAYYVCSIENSNCVQLVNIQNLEELSNG